MSCQFMKSPAQALYYVFVQPSLSYLAPKHSIRSSTPLRSLSSSLVQTRHASSNAKLSLNRNEPYATRDEAIGCRVIALRDLNGEFHPRVYLRDILQSIDRSIYRVVLIKDRDRKVPESIPICTILSSADIAAHKKRQKLLEKERAKRKRLLEPKQIEINWGSDKNDMETKMKRMCDFLKQGRRVEILLAPKKRKIRNWTQEEAANIVSSIRQRTNEVNGTKEYKKPEGKLGESLTLFFEGREIPKVEQEENEELEA